MGFLNEKRCKIYMIYKKDYKKVAIDTMIISKHPYQ